MTKYQFGLLQNVVKFPEHIDKLKDMQKSLISFLDQHPEFQDCDYRYIWMPFAHSYYINNCEKVLISDSVFKKFSVIQIPMSFTISNQITPKIEEVNENNITNEIITHQNTLMYQENDDTQYLIMKTNLFHL